MDDTPPDAGRDAGPAPCASCGSLCLEGRCLDAGFARVCRVRQDRCLECEGNSAPVCPATCPVGSPRCLPTVQVNLAGDHRATSLGGCVVRLTPLDGGADFGVWWPLSSGESLAQVPVLGGACIGRNLATGAPRTLLTCPLGAVVLTGCE